MTSTNIQHTQTNLIRSPAYDCLLCPIYNPVPLVVQRVSQVEAKIFEKLRNEPRPKDIF